MRMILCLTALLATTAIAVAQTAPQAMQTGAPLQQMIDQRLRTQIGDLLVSNIVLGAQVEALQARIAELEKPKPEK